MADLALDIGQTQTRVRLVDSTGAVQAYGPWRTTEHSQKTRGYLVPVPPDFTPAGGRLLAVGAPPTSGNNYGPRGANLFALDPITTSKSADSASNTNASLSGKRLIYHDSAHPQARDGNYSICGWNVNYDNSKGGYLTPGSPDFNNSDYQRSNESRALDAVWSAFAAVFATIDVISSSEAVVSESAADCSVVAFESCCEDAAI